jgi:hypothetical protein
MTPRAAASRQYRCPRRRLAGEGRILPGLVGARVIGARSYGFQADAPTAMPTPTRVILLTAAGRLMASPHRETDSRRPKLPSRILNLKNP